ncbi:hypothetical protein NC652_005390 [Populus alba x Populus x berolinensis]|nr:hypothetical protein NC652_005390 [Populus alba x Populus x berolinensis]
MFSNCMLIWRRRRQARRLQPATCRARYCSNIFREGSNKHRHLVVNGPALVFINDLDRQTAAAC